MSARDDILSVIRAQRVKNATRPAGYTPPAPPGDLVAAFEAHAVFANADVRILDSMADVPGAVAEMLRARNLPAIVHRPGNAFADLPWERAAGLTLKDSPPGPDDAALAHAAFGVAETGTLVYPADVARPASWHFRPGLEIAILNARDILPHLENALARLKQAGALPHTVNLVTGPSRTGDIEQTLELGAHGPKALAVLVVRE
jgi:L-lactate dehydrogenase complex protein LldG